MLLIMKKRNKKAVVLLSGGLDSTTTLYVAKRQGYHVTALIFSYGQRHRKEVLCAKRIARLAHCDYHLVDIGFPWKGSSLLDRSQKIPEQRSLQAMSRGIPSTYVPSRNIIFLSYASSLAEAIGAEAIFLGANALDYSGYPDCRPQFFKAFARVVMVATKAGVEGCPVRIHTPLLRKTKEQIIRLGRKLAVPYHLTWSCYEGKAKPCGVCDSCLLRRKGFNALKIKDPALC